MSSEKFSIRLPLLNRLVKSLSRLPGIGEKSAQRIAFSLLIRKRSEGLELSEILKESMTHLKHCRQCRNFSEYELCQICEGSDRDASQICVVEMPSDLYAFEQLKIYRGHYFVLFGHLSPIDGVLPKHLGLEQLQARFEQSPKVTEVILATNPTVEGEITAHYVAELAKGCNIFCSRIAYGIPMGAELEYLDRLTLAYAFSGRRPLPAITQD